jgi:hypothetical protein
MQDPDSDTESSSSDSSEELTPPSVRSTPQHRVVSPLPITEPLSRLSINKVMSARGSSSVRGDEAPAAPSIAATSSGKLVAAPDLYHGDRRKFTSFVSQLQLNFLNRRTELGSNEKKVIFAASHFRGSPQEWFRPYLDDHINNLSNLAGRKAETAEMFLWNNFYQALKRMYGDGDERRTAERKMEGLRQTNSVAAYASLFQQYRPQLGWNDEALLSQFRSGLNSEIKDMLFLKPDVPGTLMEYIDLCISLDQRVQERRWEKGGKALHPSNHAKKRHEPPLRRDRDEMDWEFSATRGRPRGAHQSNRGPLTPAQRKERMDKNLCLYCGKPGHRAKECKAKTNSRMAATTHTFAATHRITGESNEMNLGRIVRFTDHPNTSRARRPVLEGQRIEEARTEPRPVATPVRRFTVVSREDRAVRILTKYWVDQWCHDGTCFHSDAQHTHKRYSPVVNYPRRQISLLVKNAAEIGRLYREFRNIGEEHQDMEWYIQSARLRNAIDAEPEHIVPTTPDETDHLRDHNSEYDPESDIETGN